MDALCKEIHEKSFEYREYQVISVFIGGGTPTTVEADWIEKIMNLLREDYSLHKEAEITLEMNPGTVNKEDLEVFKKAGINRLSINPAKNAPRIPSRPEACANSEAKKMTTITKMYCATLSLNRRRKYFDSLGSSQKTINPKMRVETPNLIQ